MNVALITVLALWLALAVLFSGMVGLTAFLLMHVGGAIKSPSIRAGAIAFTSALTLALGMLALAAQVLS